MAGQDCPPRGGVPDREAACASGTRVFSRTEFCLIHPSSRSETHSGFSNWGKWPTPGMSSRVRPFGKDFGLTTSQATSGMHQSTSPRIASVGTAIRPLYKRRNSNEAPFSPKMQLR
jgi:hypothetical protein